MPGSDNAPLRDARRRSRDPVMGPDRLDSPGVRFPPPLIYLAAILLGILLDGMSPFPRLAAPLRWAGIAIVIAAVAVNVAGFRALRRAGTTVRPDRAATSLVVRGPYRITRNPLYLSLTLLHLGIALWARSVWLVLWVVPAVLVIDRFVIPREERHLESVFGETWRDYRARVRRWL